MYEFYFMFFFFCKKNLFLKQTCKTNGSVPRFATVAGFQYMPASETYVRAALLGRVLSIGVNAALSSFVFYSSGIYSDPLCNPNNLNHAGKLNNLK